MAYLTIRIKGVEGYRFERLPIAEDVVLGRSSECGLQLAAEAVSRQHAKLLRQGEQWLVVDLDSANGVRMDGKRIEGSRSLAEGSVFRLGSARLTFHLGEPPDPDQMAERGVAFHQRGPHDPESAYPCPSCETWLNIAHHEPGQSCTCPRCDHRFVVPQILPA
jgi:hypothetical protein